MVAINELLNNYSLFLIVMLRVSGMLLTAPIFSTRNVPRQLKVALVLIISFFVFMIMLPSMEVPTEIIFIPLLAGEFMIGASIGYTANLIFSIIQLAGQHIDMQMGFGMVNVMDPSTGVQSPIMGTFKYIIALLIYLLLNGHHWLLEALFYSYKVIPLNGFQMSPDLASFFIELTSGMFLAAIKIAAPLFTALFITDFVMGIISRTVPQMNVFLVGMPMKIIIGLFFLLMVIPIYIYILPVLFERSFKDVIRLIRVLGQ